MIKNCYKCGNNKHISDFGKHSRNKDGLQSQCKDCQRQYNNYRFEQLSIDKKIEKRNRQSKRQRELRKIISEIAVSHGCIDCGYKQNPAPLQFDHIRDKEFNISDMISNGFSLNRIMLEIEKCEVRCANCHAIKTSKDFNWYQ